MMKSLQEVITKELMIDAIRQNNAREGILAACQSVAEADFLHVLLKAIPALEVRSQVALGQFRGDFVYQSGSHRILFEVDGKKFHDHKRDVQRDLWILNNTDVTNVVRIPAAIVHYFRDAMMGVLAEWFSCFARWENHLRYRAEELEPIIEKVSELVDEMDYDALERFAESESVRFLGSTFAVIGSPMSFVPEWHDLWWSVDRKDYAKHKWQGIMERRTLANKDDWYKRST